MNSTPIEYADFTWNPVTGCTKVSPGCWMCYAETIASTPEYMATRGGEPFNKVVLHADRLSEPERKRKSGIILTCSMGDLFHKDVGLHFQELVFDVMSGNGARHHRFLVLTKRAAQMSSFVANIRSQKITPNIWLGTSVENQDFLYNRAPAFAGIDTPNCFLSCEPLLGEINLGMLNKYTLSSLGWVIAGGETGKGARFCRPEWVRKLRDECIYYKIPFFFKGWGDITPQGQHPVKIDGETIREYPRELLGPPLVIEVHTKRDLFS